MEAPDEVTCVCGVKWRRKPGVAGCRAINSATLPPAQVIPFGVVSENGIYGHSRFCNTDFDDKLACLNLSGV
ncbi:hypothetical protein FGF03_30355 (plasmid) [Klebsiella pneumoniae]|nr:hypothetical protein FGF03_30355 [Klebsiella pneumoniae]